MNEKFQMRMVLDKDVLQPMLDDVHGRLPAKKCKASGFDNLKTMGSAILYSFLGEVKPEDYPKGMKLRIIFEVGS